MKQFNSLIEEEQYFPAENIEREKARKLIYYVENMHSFKDGEIVQLYLKLGEDGNIYGNGMYAASNPVDCNKTFECLIGDIDSEAFTIIANITDSPVNVDSQDTSEPNVYDEISIFSFDEDGIKVTSKLNNEREPFYNFIEAYKKPKERVQIPNE